MQVSNTLNNIIRILFNPKLEAFKLFDFLVVKSDSERYIAQIIEIYDDKFDASQNVARLRLFFKLTQDNEVMPYDNFTPSKECEIIKIKQEEIENFLNNDKETFVFGINKKTSRPLNLQYDFFENNAVVIADKVDYANSISLGLAKRLSEKKNSVIIDSTGILEFEEAQTIKATKDFRMPLNYLTIDLVFDRCLPDASLEFQAKCAEILNEIKKFAKRQPMEFIPFNSFTRVLIEQYKATPYPELRLLLARLKRFQMNEIFARNKKDYENLSKTIQKNKITIINLAGLGVFWQKAFLEYITDAIKDDVYLITRINEENCSSSLINKIYCEKKNLTFIPNVSYNYKKLPSIVQYCKNYILMQSLYQRNDFLNANFALANLISSDCILFGEDTNDFLYLACDFEAKIEEKKVHYRKIALSLLDENEKEKKEITDEKKEKVKTDSQKLMEELSKFDDERLKNSKEDKSEPEIDETPEVSHDDIDLPENANDLANLDNLDNYEDALQEISVEFNESETEGDFFDGIVDTENNKKDAIKEASDDNFEKLIEEGNEQNSSFVLSAETKEQNSESTDEEEQETISDSEFSSILNESVEEDEDLDATLNLDDTDNAENNEQKEEDKQEDDLEKIDISLEPEVEVEDENKEVAADSNNGVVLTEDTQAASILETFEEKTEAPKEEVVEDIELSDDELDFFQMAKESSQKYENNSDSQKQEPKEANAEVEIAIQNEEVNLSEIADSSIDSSFNDILNTDGDKNVDAIEVDENVKIDSNLIETEEKKENLPIFKEETEKAQDAYSFKEGDVVIHKKFGKGTIIKTVKYEQKLFVQVEFENSEKKLLDPKIADIKLA